MLEELSPGEVHCATIGNLEVVVPIDPGDYVPDGSHFAKYLRQAYKDAHNQLGQLMRFVGELQSLEEGKR